MATGDTSMEKLQELLPGIEEFLLDTLAHEDLSPLAEERRQYYVERLDILRLPPSLPPRAGKRLSLELLDETIETCGTPAELVPGLCGSLPEVSSSPSIPLTRSCGSLPEGIIQDARPPEAKEKKPEGEVTEAEKDFAAKQREISRNLLASVSSEKDVEEVEDSDSAKGIKVYDDIEPSGSNKVDEEVDDDDDDGNALYEIPVARQLPPPLLPQSEDNSLSQPADVSSVATTGSVDDISDDVLDTNSSSSAWQPPPLPPRGRKRDLESAETRASMNSLDRVGLGAGSVKPPELPYRPPLAKRNEIYARSDKSEKSDGSEGDSTSYESFDEEHDNDLMNKLNIKLPKRPKKKSKGSGKLLSSKGRSSSTWEITSPFKKLENVVISGEVQHKGKLSWNRRLAAISSGCMALYKPEKDGRPVLVVPLSGFSACLGEAVAKKGYEMKMSHESGEAYTFTVDFKEWAILWCEHINNVSQGLPVQTSHQHLARTFSTGSDKDTYGSKGNLSTSNSNLSVSSDGVESDDSSKPRLRANKVMRMGSFAYRATQFFENLGKKSTTSKRKTTTNSSGSLGSPAQLDVNDHSLRGDGILEEGCSSVSSNSLSLPPPSPSSEAASPGSDDSRKRLSASSAFSLAEEPPPLPVSAPPPLPVCVKHQGFLHIFSTFNRRKWGKRWCLVKENMFECYRDQKASACELNFLLKNCVIRQALKETNSPLAVMVLENNREKITVEPLTREELGKWLKVFMVETGTNAVPAGLEEFFVEGDVEEEDHEQGLLADCEAEYTDIVTASMMNFRDLGSAPMLTSRGRSDTPPPELTSTGDEVALGAGYADRSGKVVAHVEEVEEEELAEASEKYLYTEVIKRPPTSSLDERSTREGEEESDGETDDDGGGDREEETGAGDDRVPRFSGSLAVYNSNKNTTDSGFYSVKGNNSDSDSGSEDKAERTPRTRMTSPEVTSPASAEGEGRASASPVQNTNSVSSAMCNNSTDPTAMAERISESDDVKLRLSDYDVNEEDESELEKTMTPEDFKESVTRGPNGETRPALKGCDSSHAHKNRRDSRKESPDRNSVSADPVSVTHGDPVSVTHGDPVAVTHGDPVAVTHGDPVAVTHGDPVPVTHGDPAQAQHSDPSKAKKKKKKSKRKTKTPQQPGREETTSTQGVRPSSETPHPNVSGCAPSLHQFPQPNAEASAPGNRPSSSEARTPSTPQTNSEETVDRGNTDECPGEPGASSQNDGKDSGGNEGAPLPGFDRLNRLPRPAIGYSCSSVGRELECRASEPGDANAAVRGENKTCGGADATSPKDRSVIRTVDQSRVALVALKMTPYAGQSGAGRVVQELSKPARRKTKIQTEQPGDRRRSFDKRHCQGQADLDNELLSLDNELLSEWGLSTILSRVWDDEESESEFKSDETNEESASRGWVSSRDVIGDGPVSPQNDYLPADPSTCKVADCAVSELSCRPSEAAAQWNESDRLKGPEEDEVISDLRDRLGRLREKLVQIKRKRIAVRDKRVRAFSPEERAVCDKEYLVLETECKAAASVILALEEELKAAAAKATS